MGIKDAIKMFGNKKVDPVSKPEDFRDYVIKSNKIGSYIDFDSIYDMDAKDRRNARKLQTLVKSSINDLIDRKINVDELERVMEALDQAFLYSDITDFDGEKSIHTIDVNLGDDKITIKSVPMEGPDIKYKVTIMCNYRSIIIPTGIMCLSDRYQIAYDIYRGCSNHTDTYVDDMKRDVGNALYAVSNARINYRLSTRDYLEFQNIIFVPFDIVNIGIDRNKKKTVLPYVVGAAIDISTNYIRGFAVKATEGSLIPTFLERRYDLSLFNNEELFLELLKKYDSDDIESILMNAVRTYADARLYLAGDSAMSILKDAYLKFEFNDDYKYDHAWDLIKLA